MSSLPRFIHPLSQELYSYWNAQRGARPAPYRNEIEPTDIRDLLADIFILDVEGADKYTWRLAGTRVCMIHCRELKGQDFMKDWAGSNLEPMRSLMRTVVDKNLVAVLEVTGRNHRGQAIEMEMVLMPLHVAGTDEVRVLGCLMPIDPPYWLGISPPTSRDIRTTRLIWPSTPLREPLHRSMGIADKPANRPSAPILMFPSQPNMRRVRHLMVMDGGKAG